MTLITVAVTWIVSGLAGLGLYACSYGRSPLWLALLTIGAGPAAFGSGLVTLVFERVVWRDKP